MEIYLDIDKLRYNIYKRCEDCFLSVLEGIYCYRCLENRIIWMKDDKMLLYQTTTKIYLNRIIWDSIMKSHMAVTYYYPNPEDYNITQRTIRRIIENNFRLAHLIPRFTNLNYPPKNQSLIKLLK